MSNMLVGFVPPDAKWKKMQEAWMACKNADVEVPVEIEDFFDGADPLEDGAQIDLENITQNWSGEGEDGLEIDVSRIPKNVKKLRFVHIY